MKQAEGYWGEVLCRKAGDCCFLCACNECHSGSCFRAGNFGSRHRWSGRAACAAGSCGDKLGSTFAVPMLCPVAGILRRTPFATRHFAALLRNHGNYGECKGSQQRQHSEQRCESQKAHAAFTAKRQHYVPSKMWVRGNYREQLRRKSEAGGPRDCMVGARDRSGSVPRADNVAGTASGGENRTTGLATSKCCGSTVLPCHWNCAHPSRVSVGPSTGALSIEQWCFPARLQHSGNSREGADNAGVISRKLNSNDIRMATTRRTKPSIARFLSWGCWATSWRGSGYRSPVSAILPGRRGGNSPGLRSSDPPARTSYRVRASHPLWSGGDPDLLPG